ncbi:MAG: copper chaperone PCu(A)C [Gammaproteobacteria bacterium]|nr:copper chaperone PCu(A)C [Gammaproteobacteria bacterium]
MAKLLKNGLSVTFLFLVLLSLSACDKDKKKPQDVYFFESGDIQIINPWLRKMPQGVSNTAGFMTVQNSSDKPLILEDVSIEWANMGMIHESKVVDGMAKMLHQDQLEIIDQLEFKPGGLHIMVMGVKEPLETNQRYNILLHFAGREPLAVPFQVRQAK